MGQITSLDRRGGKGTEIGRVRGLGSAHRGTGHWHMMHLTSAASLVTCAYLAFSFVLLPDLSYPAMRAWLAGIVPSLGLALMLVNIIGISVGPLVVALLTDHLFGREAMLRWGLGIGSGLLSLTAGLCLLTGLSAYRRVLRDAPDRQTAPAIVTIAGAVSRPAAPTPHSSGWRAQRRAG